MGGIVWGAAKEGNFGSLSMTKNQRVVWQWLADNCSASGVVKVSAWELSLSVGWSRQYTRKILNSLVDDGHLSVVQRGIGHGATKFRVLLPSQTFVRLVTTKPKEPASPQVPSDNQKRVTPFRLFRTSNNQGQYAHTDMRAHMQNVFDNVAINVYKPTKTGNSPFKRFRKRCDRVEKWTGPDFVCYFSYVYKVRFGEMPKLEWPKDLGAARLLLRRLGDPLTLKGYIQIAMSLAKRPPDGLHTFSYGRTYQDIKEMEVPEEILDEYDDDYVFPWLYEKLKQRGAQASDEYNARLTRRAFGIYD